MLPIFLEKIGPKCYLRCYLILSFLVIFFLEELTILKLPISSYALLSPFNKPQNPPPTPSGVIFSNIIFISFTTFLMIFFACLNNTLVWSPLERRGILRLVVGQARYASLKRWMGSLNASISVNLLIKTKIALRVTWCFNKNRPALLPKVLHIFLTKIGPVTYFEVLPVRKKNCNLFSYCLFTHIYNLYFDLLRHYFIDASFYLIFRSHPTPFFPIKWLPNQLLILVNCARERYLIIYDAIYVLEGFFM